MLVPKYAPMLCLQYAQKLFAIRPCKRAGERHLPLQRNSNTLAAEHLAFAVNDSSDGAAGLSVRGMVGGPDAGPPRLARFEGYVFLGLLNLDMPSQDWSPESSSYT